jgi:hypothetical protein
VFPPGSGSLPAGNTSAPCFCSGRTVQRRQSRGWRSSAPCETLPVIPCGSPLANQTVISATTAWQASSVLNAAVERGRAGLGPGPTSRTSSCQRIPLRLHRRTGFAKHRRWPIDCQADDRVARRTHPGTKRREPGRGLSLHHLTGFRLLFTLRRRSRHTVEHQ